MTRPEEIGPSAGWPAVIAGKYRVERVLGQGGMGVILEATHLQLDERVAIKVLRKELTQDKELAGRFLREARAAIKIRSEHVVRIHDVAALDDGVPYIVMELLTGSDLEQLVKERGPLAPGVAVDYVMQACEAIAEAHARGMVHRDLKPANLFLTRRPDGSPCVKVLDFGITKVTDIGDSDLGVTSTQAIFGSPRYMSPEQMRSARNADARSDVWALGSILFELVSARSPFDAETMPALCVAVLNDPPAQLPPHVPSAFGAVVMRCLRKRPEERFQDVGELTIALAAFGTDEAESARTRARVLGVLAASGSMRKAYASDPGPRAAPVDPPALADAAPPAFSGVTSSAWGRDSATSGARGRRLLIAASVALTAVVLVALVAYKLGRGAKTTTTLVPAPPTGVAHDEPRAAPPPEPVKVESIPVVASAPTAPSIVATIAPKPVAARRSPSEPSAAIASASVAVAQAPTPAASTQPVAPAQPSPAAPALPSQTAKPDKELFDGRK